MLHHVASSGEAFTALGTAEPLLPFVHGHFVHPEATFSGECFSAQSASDHVLSSGGRLVLFQMAWGAEHFPAVDAHESLFPLVHDQLVNSDAALG